MYQSAHVETFCGGTCPTNPANFPPCVLLPFAVLLPGYYARELASDGSVKRAALCPQKYVCPGGVPGAVFDPSNSNALPATETTIKPCANGMWTVSLGSTDPAQCCEWPWGDTTGGMHCSMSAMLALSPQIAAHTLCSQHACHCPVMPCSDAAGPLHCQRDNTAVPTHILQGWLGGQCSGLSVVW
jgi:hypothetical protein